MNLDLHFGVGRVVGIDTLHVDPAGNNIPIMFVRSFVDGNLLNVPWLPDASEQNMPTRNQKILYFRVGNHDTYHVKTYGNNGPHIRKGKFGLDEGEFVHQSEAGKGYIKGDKLGRLLGATGDAASSFTADQDGWTFQSPNFTIDCFGVCTMQMKSDGSYRLAMGDKGKDPDVVIEVSKDRKISMTTISDIVMKAGGKIVLDGDWVAGPGASDPEKAALFGKVVTAGPGGTHPFDLATGEPIKGSDSGSVAS